VLDITPFVHVTVNLDLVLLSLLETIYQSSCYLAFRKRRLTNCIGYKLLDCRTIVGEEVGENVGSVVGCFKYHYYPGPDVHLWGPRGNQNVEDPNSNNKFRLWQLFLVLILTITENTNFSSF
jgi:hypothetical protein